MCPFKYSVLQNIHIYMYLKKKHLQVVLLSLQQMRSKSALDVEYSLECLSGILI